MSLASQLPALCDRQQPRWPAAPGPPRNEGFKLIINFVNNWSDYGGIPVCMTAFGGSRDNWYTNSWAQSQYKAYEAAVVNAISTHVFVWELANEPCCKGCITDVV
ncbi:uncharacterized protein B0T23DRAFT_398301 [Neurospora hispaniola]|uniref:Glycoside hydrolase family 5 domain-containing protein n=1 Tax=Neurospora hispaniola TaxID=588809 RepID=A0AAJ0I1V0_9PEZI|nr:hypothetical protein B0T23DRAFT_398301 [Neurospora hispaniola]